MTYEMQKWIAPAKVNLTLHITGKRDDGYHILDSLVVFTDFGDVIRVAHADEFGVFVTGPFARAVDPFNNSIIDAVRWFENWSGHKVLASIHLEKNLPVAAGLGGGTSDCATMIRALCELYDVIPPEPHALVELGADVPVCFYGAPSHMRGIGEEIEAVELKRNYGILLVNPGVSVSTKSIFASPELSFSAASGAVDFHDNFLQGYNDMQAAAIVECPQIALALDAVAQTEPMIARMSGSGATVFGVYENLQEAQAARDEVRAAHTDYWVAASMIKPSA